MRRRFGRRRVGAILLTGAIGVWIATGMPTFTASTFGDIPSERSTGAPSVQDAPAAPEAPLGSSHRREHSDEAPEEAEGTPSPFTTTAPRGAIDRSTWPTAVEIPALDVRAPVLTIGHDTTGELIVPASPMDVGWFQSGSVPGEAGVALLTSHVDTRTEGRGVFAGIVTLAPDDTIAITTADGTVQQWRVTARTQHLKSELPAELFARAGAPVLALVTCGGPFDPAARSYRDNVIVWAERAT